jgi:hypothetical protein
MYVPVLALPEMGKPYEVYTDASKEGLGGVLIQERMVIAYILRKLNRIRIIIPPMIWNWQSLSLP